MSLPQKKKKKTEEEKTNKRKNQPTLKTLPPYDIPSAYFLIFLAQREISLSVKKKEPKNVRGGP